NSNNETGFIIERSLDGSTGWAAVTGSPAAANSTSFSDTTVSASTQYFYRVRATNSVGDSNNSNTANATTPVQPTKPADPSNLVATTASTTQINLTWLDNSNNETGFKIERSLDGSTGWTLLTTTAANATSYSNTGLQPGTQYFYRVRATNAVGDSNNTTVANAITQPGLPAPWKDGDVGSVGTAGSATQNLGTYTVKGAGSDIGGTADSFNFVYQSLSGGGSIVAKVTSMQNTNSTAKAGIVI